MIISQARLACAYSFTNTATLRDWLPNTASITCLPPMSLSHNCHLRCLRFLLTPYTQILGWIGGCLQPSSRLNDVLPQPILGSGKRSAPWIHTNDRCRNLMHRHGWDLVLCHCPADCHIHLIIEIVQLAVHVLALSAG